MSKNKWMSQLNKLDGAADLNYNPFAEGNTLRVDSPSVNWVFGRGCGLPLGYSAVLYGPPKSGKSLLTNLMAASVHKTDSEGLVLKFNTEMREEGQLSDYWGIDKERYIAYNVKDPKQIFDRVKDEVLPMLQDGMPLKLIIIDSLQGVSGIRQQEAESVTNHQVGDHAMTIQKGLDILLPIIRKHKIAFIATEHIRSNIDANNKYAPKEKMGGAWAEKHFFEYFVEVKKDGAADGRADLLGNEFLDESVTDFRGKNEKTGCKIYVRMDQSSVGVEGRSGQFTLDYKKGLVNTHEEVFTMAKNMGIVSMPNNRTYVFNETKWSSKEDFLTALRDNTELQKQILTKIYSKDMY